MAASRSQQGRDGSSLASVGIWPPLQWALSHWRLLVLLASPPYPRTVSSPPLSAAIFDSSLLYYGSAGAGPTGSLPHVLGLSLLSRHLFLLVLVPRAARGKGHLGFLNSRIVRQQRSPCGQALGGFTVPFEKPHRHFILFIFCTCSFGLKRVWFLRSSK